MGDRERPVRDGRDAGSNELGAERAADRVAPCFGRRLTARAKLPITREKNDGVIDAVAEDDGPEEHPGRVHVAESKVREGVRGAHAEKRRKRDDDEPGRIHLKATCAPHYFRVLRQRAAADHMRVEPAHSHGKPGAGHPGGGNHNMAAMTKGCLAGSAICFVSHTGEVFPCGYLPVSAGNVRKQKMSDIWNDSAVFGRLRNVDALEGKCGLCEFNKICLGCRARAYYATGNYMAEEPYCVYQPKRMRDAEHMFREV